MPLRKILAGVLLVSLGAAAVFGAAGILMSSNSGGWQIVSTCITTAVVAVVMLLLVRITQENPLSLGVGSALVLIEYLLMLGMTWGLFNQTEYALLTVAAIFITGAPLTVFLHYLRQPVSY
ncbi:MAG TPA: hypothetical protein VF669_22355, partial [Tepidisphaeraceae bacterium]